MSKSVRKEVLQLLPTSKRLRIIRKKSLGRMEDVCHLNNECYELLEIEKKSAGGYNTTNIIMISDNITYIMKYIRSLGRMLEELAESCKELEEFLNDQQEKYVCPLSLRWRVKRMLYVSELLSNVIGEMRNIHSELIEEFMLLLQEKMITAVLKEV